MGKTRDLFKNIRDTKGTFHAKMGSIKDRNGMDLTEAEDIKKRWQEYTEELYKKDLHDPDNHNGVITHLEPDILECEVKWALESITMNKASGGDGSVVSDSSDPMDCGLPGSSVHGIFQARVLEWGAIAFSFSSVQFSRSVVSDSLQPHESQHARPPCPSTSTSFVHSDAF